MGAMWHGTQTWVGVGGGSQKHSFQNSKQPPHLWFPSEPALCSWPLLQSDLSGDLNRDPHLLQGPAFRLILQKHGRWNLLEAQEPCVITVLQAEEGGVGSLPPPLDMWL